MEKWKSRGKGSKAESVLPPTRRPTGSTCLPVDKKKDRKWSFGGLLKRISSGQNHDVSSNDEDITYIPGHMLSKRSMKKPSKMKSKLGKIPLRAETKELSEVAAEVSYGSKDTLELIRSLQANIDHSQDSLCQCNDSVNSRSSEGSLDALGKASRINRMKARAQAKRDRLCGNTSSDEDSHRSSQSLAQLRSDDSTQNVQVPQRSDSCNRRTRAARTERYIRRMYRDDGTSGSDSKILEPNALPRAIQPAPSQFSSKSMDSSLWRTNDVTRSVSQGGSSPSVIPERTLVVDRHFPPRDRPRNSQLLNRPASGCLRDMNENETFEREKRTWPQNFRRATPQNEIYGSLRQPKVLPPEPPPRSSKSRVFTNAYNNAPFAFNAVNPETQSSRRYLTPIETHNGRSYNSDNDVLLSDYVAPVRLRYLWQNSDKLENRRESPVEQDQPYYQKNGYCNSLDRPRRHNYSPASRKPMEYQEDQENYDPRPYFPERIPPSSNYGARSTSSLPKGVQLFSRQRLSHCGDDTFSIAPHSLNSTEKPLEDHIIPKLRKPREISSCQNSSMCLTRTLDDEEAERKRSSKNLEDALSELEAIYNSLRLSDEDLLERAEQRSMEEYRDKAAKSAVGNSLKSSDTSSNEKEEIGRDRSSVLLHQQENDSRIKDDMAYRRMNPKERPPSVNGQASLSQISYLATSPNLSYRDGDFIDQRPRSRRGTPDLMRDDLLVRSISHANNTLKVIEPQPPFGIPLGPVTSATESDYLHVKPPKLGQTRSLYIPQSEPDVVSDDLAFRNLRKDGPKDFATSFNKNNTDLFIQTDSTGESPIFSKSTFAFGTKKKRAVRSMSADLYGIMGKEKGKQNDWYNDYIQSTQKLKFVKNDTSPVDNKEHLSYRNFKHLDSKSPDIDDSRDTFRCSTNHFGLDINGNRPKSALQRKIQVYVPQETAIAEAANKSLSISDAMLDGKRQDLIKLIGTESDDSSPERCDSRLSSRSDAFTSKNDKTKTIESFTEQEVSEYKQLCQDLEKLIQRTAEPDTEENEEEKDIKCVSEENNSQSEFDELEKLLIDDYEIAASIATFDEIVTSTERDDDQSSSRSTGLGAESLSSDNLQCSPTKIASKFADDDASSTSELGIGSSNTGSSFTDSVYDKFNQLLREVNDVPYVEPTKTINKYPIDELDATTNLHESNRSIDENLIHESSEESVVMEETQEPTVNDTYDDLEVKTEAIGTNSTEERLASQPDESSNRPMRAQKGGKPDEDERKMEKKEIGAVEKPAYRQGENVEDERACNDGFYAFKDFSKHTVRKLCHVTNRVTAYHIVLCSLFLTLLITMIVAQ